MRGIVVRMAAACLLLCSLGAHAQTLSCGVYKTTGSDDGHLLVEGNGKAYRYLSSADYVSGKDLNFYALQGTQFKLMDARFGHVFEYRVQARAPQLRSTVEILDDYQLVKPAACAAPVPPPAPGSCLADIAACSAGIRDETMPLPALKQACFDGLPYACTQYISRLQVLDKSASAETAPARQRFAEPAACREGTAAFDAKACEAEAQKVMMQVLVETIASSFTDEMPVLSPAHLDELPALCEAQPSETTCTAVAETLWRGQRLQPAVAALVRACADQNDSYTCKRAQALQPVFRTATPEFVPATTVPCGRYQNLNTTDSVSELVFGDRAIVTYLYGTHTRARLREGMLLLRHEQGGDFILRPLRDGRLVALDKHLLYSVFAPDEATGERCAPAPAFFEKPMAMDCPAADLEAAKACCASGKAHGCNTAGNMLAIEEKWPEAIPYYAKVCEAGIRFGCENLVSGKQLADDASADEQLRAICARNPQHVACDVIETRLAPRKLPEEAPAKFRKY